jgi:hypothetical protein
MGRPNMEVNVQLFGAERAMELAEVSEWLDWMRREMPAAGMELPCEETSVLLAVNAVRFAERIRPLSLHFTSEIRCRVVEAAILHQWWRLQRKLSKKEKGVLARRNQGLCVVEVQRHLRWPDANGRCLVEGSDGHRYTAVCPIRMEEKKALATHMIGACVARLMGLAKPTPVALAVKATQGPCRVGICLGVRCRTPESEPNLEDTAGEVNRTGTKFDVGRLVFDILMLNAAPQYRQTSLDGTGQDQPFEYCRCLADADWSRFLRSSYSERVAPEWAAGRIRCFEQFSPWLKRVAQLDSHRLWQLAFEIPPEWYDSDRITLTRVLDKIEERRWDIGRTIEHLAGIGYFPRFRSALAHSSEVGPLTTNASVVVQ